jgi:DNA helicase-2/ATP-dependent DNA helicase PcrA
MIQHFSRLQDEDIDVKEYLEFAKRLKKKAKTKEEKLEAKKTLELAKAFKVYEELKIKKGFMDFGDLIVKTLRLFRERPNVLKEYQEKFKYILVDEFQDTNFAQNELAILLSKKDRNITVCGDDDQSIYRFRGAAVSNIFQFKKHFKKKATVVLTKNYRSAQEILDKAYQLIQNNNPDRLEVFEKVDKKLISQRKDAMGELGFIHADRVENEAEAVTRKIKELVDDGYDYKDFAILVRANNHAEPFTRALSRKGMPFQFLGPGRLFRQSEVVDLISYLKVLNDFEDSVSLFRLLSIDYFDIPARDLASMGNYAKRKNISLFEVCEKIDDVYVTDKTKKKIKKIVKVVKSNLKQIRRETGGQLLYYFLQDTGLLQKLLNPQSSEAEKSARNISKFFDKLKTYEVDHEDATVPAIVDWIELSSELGESPLAADSDWTEINAVNLLTVHSAKGLEFPIVFLVNLVSQRFPTINRRETIPISEDLIKEVLPAGDYHAEEERRLFYVGMTRAKDKLFFTAADFYGEGKREKKLSPFIFEALGDDIAAAEYKEDQKQLSFLDYKTLSKKVEQQKLPVHVDYLSYSQIQTFEICPLHYKLRYILKIPTPPSSALSFGSSVHATLNDFYDLVKKGEKANEKLILELLDKNWIDEGYKSKAHEKESLKRGKRILKDYFKKEFDKKKIPYSLEKMFKVPIRGKKGWVMVGGRIDRVDVLNEKEIEIIDYKTGERVPSQREADKDMQLTIYALAAVSIKEKPFGIKPENVKLSFYYLDKGKKITTQRTKEQLEEAKKYILEVKNKIEKSNFACSGHIFCQSKCEYSLMCRADLNS